VSTTQPTTVPEQKTRLAPMVRVLIHNDDVTPMDFVVRILVEVFNRSFVDSVKIMREAHTGAVAHVETVPLETAEFHVDKAHSLSRTQHFPLTFTIEPEALGPLDFS
jgi:ATP-dependent Clp protease adaptor protein ClpS